MACQSDKRVQKCFRKAKLYVICLFNALGCKEQMQLNFIPFLAQGKVNGNNYK